MRLFLSSQAEVLEPREGDGGAPIGERGLDLDLHAAAI